jgi:hypothetical protein
MLNLFLAESDVEEESCKLHESSSSCSETEVLDQEIPYKENNSGNFPHFL